jgi:hypothetical protein
MFAYESSKTHYNQKRIKQIKEFYDCFDASQANDFSIPIQRSDSSSDEDGDAKELGDVLLSLKSNNDKKAVVV